MDLDEQDMQKSFADAEYAAKKKQTRRGRFLTEIEAATLWSALVVAIFPSQRFQTCRKRWFKCCLAHGYASERTQNPQEKQARPAERSAGANQSERARQGWTLCSRCQMLVQASQDLLSRVGEECGAAVLFVRIRQFGVGAQISSRPTYRNCARSLNKRSH